MSNLFKQIIIFTLISVVISTGEYSITGNENYTVMGSVMGNLAFAGQDKYGFSKLRLSGYGTISHTFDDSDEIIQFRDVSRTFSDSNDLDNNSTWRMDSRIGLQADYQFNQKIESVIQGVLRDHADPTFANSIELAYVGVRPLPQLNLRAGRIAYDAFLMSDIRNTGYAYLWVRPPTEFYGWVPIFSINGADATYKIDQGDVQWRIKVQGGESGFGIVMGKDIYDFQANDLLTLTLARESGPFKIKAGYSAFTSINEVNGFKTLHKGFEAIANAADNLSFPEVKSEVISLQNDITFKDNDVSYMTLGACYDDGTLIAQAEIGRSTATGDVLPNGDMGYLSVGYRMGDFTPYLTFSKITPGTDLHKSTSDWSVIQESLPSSFDAEEFHSQAIDDVLNSTRMEQYTNSLGLRWDFSNQAAFKLQWNNTHIKPFGYGLLERAINILSYSNSVNLYSFSMEFVF